MRLVGVCLLLLAWAAGVAWSAPTPTQTCPGIEEGHCRGLCQQAICRALEDFRTATYNSSYAAWPRSRGWWGGVDGCLADLGNRTHRHPSYCDRFGVECCNRAEHHHEDCNRFAVTGLVLEVNFLNCSISDPLLLQALGQLHACGLTRVVLQSNDLSGTLSAAWGNFTQLTHLNLANNWLSGTLPSSLRQLTKLRKLALGANFLTGPLPQWLGELKSLKELRLGANLGTGTNGSRGFFGTLHASLGQLAKLQVLDLQSNSLTGQLPQELCPPGSQLEMVQVRNNLLTGPLEPLTRCTELTQLDVSGNAFTQGLTGVSSSNWSKLVLLDGSHNFLTGSIPTGIYHLPVLAYLGLSHNRLSGSLSRDIALMSYVSQLKLSHNFLSGSLEEGLWTLPQLQGADFSNNYLTGTISHMAGLTLGLQQLILDNNSFVGPLPPNLGHLRNLNRISLRKTNISCVPLSIYTSAHSHNSTNSSTGSNSSASQYNGTNSSSSDDDAEYLRLDSNYRCSESELLPCFLTFSEHAVPRTDATNMACPAVERLPHGSAVEACAGSAPWQLGEFASAVAVTQTAEQSWELDPAVYQYRSCKCLKGYAPRWTFNDTVLTCTPKSSSLPASAIISIAASAAGALLLAAVGLLVWLRLTVQLRPKWQREKQLLANRKKGVPCGAAASVVVTDVEQYSAMMQVNPQLTTKALGLHNTVMRVAAAAHAGHVIEQEGDSWSVAFHSPMDAVAFCLQVQQALAKTNWPSEMVSRSHNSSRPLSGSSNISVHDSAADGSGNMSPRSKPLRPSIKGDGNSYSTLQHQHQTATPGMGAVSTATQPPCCLTDFHASPAVCKNSNSRGGLLELMARQSTKSDKPGSKGLHQPPPAVCCAADSISSVHSAASATSFRTSGSGPEHSIAYLAAAMHGSSDLQTPFARLFGGLCPHHGGGATSAVDQDSFCTAADCAEGMAEDDDDVIPALRSMASHSGQHGLGSSRSSRFWNLLGVDQVGGRASEGHGPMPDAVRGLKVRMGVASGFVPADTHVCRCALMQLAKAVSDMANGGQILLDGTTFAGIRDRLTELGTVDARGYNDKLWSAAAMAAMRQQTTGLLGLSNVLAGCCRGIDPGTQLETDVLALDMGAYYTDTTARLLQQAAAPGADSTRSAASVAAATATEIGDAAVAGAALAMEAGSCSSSSHGYGSVGDLCVYSVTPRSLQERVKLWKDMLNFKPGTQQTARGYFQAPGTMVAHLGTSAAAGEAPEPPCLPTTAMVFAEVEGGHALVRRRPELARLVHTTLTQLLQVLLAALPEADGQCDGYLCREQEGDMKYMLAFREPSRALEWCLLVQEVLLYVPWPREVLDDFGHDSSSIAAAPEVLAALAGSKDAGSGGNSSSSACLGPCLRMGLAEGQPNSIMPDHLGRADYHGFHVNLAARLMGAAAAPGQVVTTIEMAERIFSTWRYEAEGHSQHSSHNQGQPQQPQQPPGDSDLMTAVHAAAAAHEGYSAEATGPQRVCTGATGSLPAGPLHNGPHMPLCHHPSVSPQCQSQRVSSLQRPDITSLLGNKSTNLLPGPSYPLRQALVEAHHLGCYALKGCGTVEVVTFLTDTIPVLEWPRAEASKGSKGTLLSAVSGPVVGLQGCPVALPAVLPALRRAWRVAGGVAAAAAVGRGGD